MLGLELTSETMLCLGIMFILSGIFFFYMKKQITHLEDAQIEQAKLLQHIIANISALPVSGMGANLSGASLSDANVSGASLSGASLSGANLSDANISGENANSSEKYQGGNLIDVSDGEENSDSEEEDDSESEGENSSDSEEESDEEDLVNDVEEVKLDKSTLREFSALPAQEVDLNAIDEDSIVEIPNTVKVINMNAGTAEHEPEEVNLDVESLTSTNLDEDDDTLTINSSVSGANLAKTSLKALKVGDLRKMVIERGLHSDPSKVKKAELITLLQQH